MSKILIRKITMIIFLVVSIMVILIGIIVSRMLYLTTATKGDLITNNSNGKAALLVIDLQKDTLSIPQYDDTKVKLMNNINNAIIYSTENDIDVLYIKQEYSNYFDLFLSGGKYKVSSEGSYFSEDLVCHSSRAK